MFPLCSSSLSRTQQLAARGGLWPTLMQVLTRIPFPPSSPTAYGEDALCAIRPRSDACLPLSGPPPCPTSQGCSAAPAHAPLCAPNQRRCHLPTSAFFQQKTKTTQKRPRSEQQQTPKTWGLRERHQRQSPPWPRAPLLLIPTVWGRTADAPLRDAAGDGAHRGYRDIYIYY